jgi:hypothetical protein
VEADAEPVKAGREQVVDRQRHAGRVELLEYRTDSTDCRRVAIVDAWQLDQGHLEGLKVGDGARPGIPPLSSKALVTFRVVLPEPVVAAVAPDQKVLRAEEMGARQDLPRVLKVRTVETVQLAPGPIEDYLVVVGIIQEEVQIDEEPAPLTGVLQGQVRRRERVDERREPLLAIEDQEFRAGLGEEGLGAPDEDRREGRTLGITAEEQQRSNKVAAEDGPEEVRHLVPAPDEVPLEVR